MAVKELLRGQEEALLVSTNAVPLYVLPIQSSLNKSIGQNFIGNGW